MAETAKHFTLRGHSVTGSVCRSCVCVWGGSNKSQPALNRLCPTVNSGGTWVYYSQLWRSDSSDHKIWLIPLKFAAVLNCTNPETDLLIYVYIKLLKCFLGHVSMHYILSFLLPNFLKRTTINCYIYSAYHSTCEVSLSQNPSSTLLHAIPSAHPPPPQKKTNPGLPHPSH